MSIHSAAKVRHAFEACRLERITKLRFGVINSHQARNVIWVEVLRKVVGNVVGNAKCGQAEKTSKHNKCKDVS